MFVQHQQFQLYQMSKRTQERTGEERIVAKSKLTMDLASRSMECCMGKQIGVVLEFPPIQRIASIRRRTAGIRAEKFLGFTTFQILAEIQRMMSSMNCNPEPFKGRIIFMSMYNDINGEIQTTKKYVLLTPPLWPNMQRNSLYDIGHSSGPDQKRNGTQWAITNPADNLAESLKHFL